MATKKEAPKAIRILKVRRTRKHIFIDYLHGDDEKTEKSRDNPLPSFTKSLDALPPIVCQLLGLPKEYAEGMVASGLTISDAKGNDMVTLVAKKPLADAAGPFNIATPLRLMDLPKVEGTYNPPLSESQADAVDKVLECAKEYIRGERAQGQIQFDEGDEDEEEMKEGEQANDGQSTIPFGGAAAPSETDGDKAVAKHNKRRKKKK